MKPRLLLLLLLLCSALTSFAQQSADYQSMTKANANIVSDADPAILRHGYRAFIDLESHYRGAAISFSTSHGYQFDPHIYVGGGVGFMAVIGGYGPYAFLDLRYDFAEAKHSPFVSLRVNTFTSVQPMIGYRFNHFSLGVNAWTDFTSRDSFVMFSLSRDFGGRKK